MGWWKPAWTGPGDSTSHMSFLLSLTNSTDVKTKPTIKWRENTFLWWALLFSTTFCRCLLLKMQMMQMLSSVKPTNMSQQSMWADSAVLPEPCAQPLSIFDDMQHTWMWWTISNAGRTVRNMTTRPGIRRFQCNDNSLTTHTVLSGFLGGTHRLSVFSLVPVLREVEGEDQLDERPFVRAIVSTLQPDWCLLTC